MNAAKTIVQSMNSAGVVTNEKAFFKAMDAFAEEFNGDDLDAYEALVAEGMNEDIALDLIHKYVTADDLDGECEDDDCLHRARYTIRRRSRVRMTTCRWVHRSAPGRGVIPRFLFAHCVAGVHHRAPVSRCLHPHRRHGREKSIAVLWRLLQLIAQAPFSI